MFGLKKSCVKKYWSIYERIWKRHYGKINKIGIIGSWSEVSTKSNKRAYTKNKVCMRVGREEEKCFSACVEYVMLLSMSPYMDGVLKKVGVPVVDKGKSIKYGLEEKESELVTVCK